MAAPALAGHPDRIQQWFQLGALMALAGRDQHPKGPASAIAGQVELGGQPTPAASQCLVGLGNQA